MRVANQRVSSPFVFLSCVAYDGFLKISSVGLYVLAVNYFASKKALSK